MLNYLSNFRLKIYKIREYLVKIIDIIKIFFKDSLNYFLAYFLKNININNILYLTITRLNMK